MTGITWLHLSDWHQGAEDNDKSLVQFDRLNVVLPKLIEDIKNRKEISPDLSQVDFIVFSGDVAFSGKKEQYDNAYQNFFDPILKATNLTKDQLFIVPGNHDLDREVVKDSDYSSVLKQPFGDGDDFKTDEDVKKALTDNKKERFKSLLKPFSSFKEFLGKHPEENEPIYGYFGELKVNSKQVALLGINSALMAGRENSQKKIDDYGKLIVGEPQVDELLKKAENFDVKIAVLHHPFEWLTEFDRSEIKKLLTKSCHFILCGHQHESQIYQVQGLEGDYIIIPAGASYVSRNYPNGYNFVHLDFKSQRGKVYLRRWSNRQRVWMKDEEAYNNGEYTFRLPKDLSKAPTTAIEAVNPNPVPVINKADLEAHYNQLWLSITNGLIVPFLGADINLCDRRSNSLPWTPDSNFPPSSREIAKYLDENICGGTYLQTIRCPLCNPDEVLPDECPIVRGIVTRRELQHISQYVEVSSHLSTLNQAIDRIYNKSYIANRLHNILAKLIRFMKEKNYIDRIRPREGRDDISRYPLIVTTNFDSVLENTFKGANQEFDLVFYKISQKKFFHQRFCNYKDNDNTFLVEEIQETPIDKADEYTKLSLNERPVILKLYSPPDWTADRENNFTITEDQFINYLVSSDIVKLIPPVLVNKLKSSSLWFLGYSLNYWNLRVILNRIWPQGIT
jgi:predicted phosphodiesterase